MFRKNEGYKQSSLFDVEQSFTKAQQKMWVNSKEHKFFECFFSKIDEDAFSVLYSDKKSRPNVPVNQLVGSLIFKHLNDWTFEELFTNLSFNLLTRHAIGIHEVKQDVFAPASLYNFQNRVIKHLKDTGEDLFMQVFNQLTADQIKELGIETNIQRGDSFLMGSNIYDYNRLGLLIEVVQRVGRILTKSDKKKLGHLFEYYSKHKADYYCYRIKNADLPSEMMRLSELYLLVYHLLKENNYEGEKEVTIFHRVFSEHFIINKEKISIIVNEDLHSSILLSPDDPEATFRKKRKLKSKGFVGHLSETANPENSLQLITDCIVTKNNVDDSHILEGRLPEMLRKTPDLDEYHSDSAYANEQIDRTMKENDIKQIHARVRGRKSASGIKISVEKEKVIVECGGGQKVEATKPGKTWKAVFNYSICRKCPFKDVCNTKIVGVKTGKSKRTLTFYGKKILAHQRMKNIESLPVRRKKLRANVEATVKEAKRGMKNEKLRVRGLIKANFYLIWTAISINIGRITRYSAKNRLYLIDFIVSRLMSLQVKSRRNLSLSVK